MPHQAPDRITITVDAPGVGDFPPNQEVGTIYEIAINGVGYMLHDSPEDPDRSLRRVVPNLDPPRLATSDTPFDQAIERYTFVTFHEWDGGRGQRWLNRESSTSSRFLESEGVDPFSEAGRVSLLPAMESLLAEPSSDLRVVAVGDDLYAQVGPSNLRRFVGSSETWASAFEVTDGVGSVTITDLASDGQYWYAATGSAVLRGQDTNPAANWSTIDVEKVRWAAGRICAAAKGAGSATPNIFTTLAPDGSEEVMGGHLVLDDGHTVVLGAVAKGTFYFGSYAGDKGVLWGWPLGVDENGSPFVPFVAWDMPPGQIPTAIGAGSGDVWIRAVQAEGPNTGRTAVYRGIVSGNELTPFLVAELGQDVAEGAFLELDDKVLFSWRNHDDDAAALGAVYLPTGGHARWLLPKVDGPVRSLVEWRGREVAAVVGHGVYLRSVDSWETSGWVRTSVVDGGSTLDKVVDDVTLEAATLQNGQSAELAYSLDGGNSYLSLGSLSTQGARRAVFPLNVKTGSFGLQLTLTGPGTNQASAHSVQGRYHALGLADKIVQVPVKAFDQMSGLNGAPLPTNGPGTAVKTIRSLEGLAQSRVLFQDIDWHLTGVAEIYEVVSADVRMVAIYDPQQAHNVVGGYVVLTLRKTGAS